MKQLIPRHPRNLIHVVCVIAAMICTALTAGQDFETLKKTIQQRAVKIQEAKDLGEFSEGFDGLLVDTKSITVASNELMLAENADRKQMFELIAARCGQDAGTIARMFAQKAGRVPDAMPASGSTAGQNPTLPKAESPDARLHGQNGSIQDRVDQASRDYFARAGVSKTYDIAVDVMKESRNKIKIMSMGSATQQSPEFYEVLNSTLQGIDLKIQASRVKLKETFEELKEVDAEQVSKAFDDKIRELDQKTPAEEVSSSAREARCLELTKKFALDYVRFRKFDFDSWESGIAEILQKGK